MTRYFNPNSNRSLQDYMLYGKDNLGDNCIQIFYFGSNIVGYTVGNFV